MATAGKNDPCPCGSGKVYEDCCLIRDVLPAGRMDAKTFSRSVLEILENRKFESHAEAQACIDKLTRERNSSPLEDFSGISPVQMYRFFHYPFDSPGLIDYNLEIKRFPDAAFFKLFSHLMQGVVNEDLKATALGNLPQKFVLAAALHYFGEAEHAKMRRYMSFRTETDVMALHVVRLIAEAAGFIRKYKKRFQATKAGQRIVQQGLDGPAFFALFQAYTRKFNWAYADRYPDIPTIQQSFLFSLYLLSKYGDALRPASFYGDLFVKAFPVALEETPECSYATREDTLRSCYAVRTLGRFGHFFGFVTIDGDDNGLWIEKRAVRKTSFLDAWLRFSIP
ncbi:MAG: SEC-C domain-containing protein [Nitrospirae bacterium]|nr:SEC-C domain-containing protein [Nitrospirota bacterium]NTW66727.1 SEC-C domain-containing protein [Nitrospirota bacterium]